MEKFLEISNVIGRYARSGVEAIVELFAGIMVAIIVGLIWMATAKLIYLPFIHPILAAGAVGSILRLMISARHRIIIFGIGFLVGCVLYGTFRYSEYLEFINAWQGIDFDFVDFVIFQAQGEYELSLGTDLGSIPLSSINDPSLIFLYWLIEIAIVLGITTMLPMGLLDEE